MPDLGSVIAFAIVLDNSGAQPVIRVVDTSAYPAGIAQQIAGVLSITQPDGLTIANADFTNPDVFWNGGALNQAAKALRLANNSRFQNGGYSLTYTVRCPGYTDTPLTQTFVLNYTAPVPVMVAAFDNFTPSLRVTDATTWGVAGLSFIGVAESWAGVIRSVGGTNQAIVGAGISFDLSFGGAYYDADYDITLTAIATWQLTAPTPSVTVVDKFVPPMETFTSEIPPTLAQLLTGLTTLKSQLDAQNNGNLYGNTVYGNLLNAYNFAVAVYTHLVDRGQIGSLAGLSAYVYQLQLLFNNGVTPPYTNTNNPIPAYNWGGSSGSSAWASITGKPSTNKIAWTVGAGGFPLAGANSITDARIANIPLLQILMFRGGVFYDLVTKASTPSNTLNWTDALGDGERVSIILLPL